MLSKISETQKPRGLSLGKVYNQKHLSKMNKFPIRISKAPKGALVEVVIELNDSQFEKLENKDLLPQIESIAKDLHLTWDVESDPESHDHMKLVVIGVNMPWPVNDFSMHDAELQAINFMSTIDNLELEKHENVPAQETRESAETKEFVQALLTDLNLPKEDGDHVIGAVVVDRDSANFGLLLPGMGWGRIGYALLKEMCELYLEKHAKD